MTFVYPTFLWALLAISIPVIIHLFNFRRYKKIYFTNVRFLRELQEESKSKSRLKEILILMCRCLALAALALAFAQPVLKDEKQGKTDAGANAVSIYIDNSFSMDNVQKQGPLLDIARMNAKSIVKAFGGADKIQMLTNDFEGKHQRFYSREDALNKIDEIKSSSSVRNVNDVIRRQYEFLNSSGLKNKKIFLLSDAQKSTFNLKELVEDTSVKVTLIPLQANRVNNVYVDTCWFETPLQQIGFIQKLHAIVVNMGNSTVNAGSAKLFLNKQPLALASFSVDAGDKKEIQFTFECKQSGFNFGSVKIEDYPVTFDDELFFAFNSRINIGVCLINGKDQKESAFEALFKGDSLFQLSSFSEQSVDYSKFKSSDVLVLNQLSDISSGLQEECDKFVKKGGSLLIVPAANSNLVSYNQMLGNFQMPTLTQLDTFTVKTEKIETAGKFFTGVFEKMEDRLNLPVVNRHFKTSMNSRSDFERVLILLNGDPLLGFVKKGEAFVYLLTSPLDQRSSNFNKHALFVPTVYRICFNSLKTTSLFYTVNSNNILTLKNEGSAGDRPPHIREINNKADVIPEIHTVENNQLLYTRGQISSPGFYDIFRNEDKVMPLAFNFSRKESDLRCYSVEEINKIITDKGLKTFRVLESNQQDISKQIAEAAQGKKLWKLFIILALSFLIIEILLLRYLK